MSRPGVPRSRSTGSVLPPRARSSPGDHDRGLSPRPMKDGSGGRGAKSIESRDQLVIVGTAGRADVLVADGTTRGAAERTRAP